MRLAMSCMGWLLFRLPSRNSLSCSPVMYDGTGPTGADTAPGVPAPLAAWHVAAGRHAALGQPARQICLAVRPGIFARRWPRLRTAAATDTTRCSACPAASGDWTMAVIGRGLAARAVAQPDLGALLRRWKSPSCFGQVLVRLGRQVGVGRYRAVARRAVTGLAQAMMPRVASPLVSELFALGRHPAWPPARWHRPRNLEKRRSYPKPIRPPPTSGTAHAS